MKTGNQDLQNKIKNYINECYFDIAPNPSLASKLALDEAQLARMLTRIAVSAATIITTTLSLRQYVKDAFLNSKRSKL